MYERKKLTKKKVKFNKPRIQVRQTKNPILENLHNTLKSFAYKYVEVKYDGLPPSTNTTYDKKVYRGAKGKSTLNVELSKEHADFRIALRCALKKKGLHEYKPKGILYAVVEMYSPKWLNKTDSTPKKKDSDNNIKPLMDGLEEGLGFPDEMAFSHLVFKQYTEGNCYTIITLYELSPAIYNQ